MGVAQRVVKDGTHLGVVVVVADADRVRDVLSPVYAALGLDWRPETTGSLADERRGLTWDAARAAIEAEYSELYSLAPAELDADTLALARSLAPDHKSLG
jgi:hypothetical protein